MPQYEMLHIVQEPPHTVLLFTYMLQIAVADIPFVAEVTKYSC